MSPLHQDLSNDTTFSQIKSRVPAPLSCSSFKKIYKLFDTFQKNLSNSALPHTVNLHTIFAVHCTYRTGLHCKIKKPYSKLFVHRGLQIQNQIQGVGKKKSKFSKCFFGGSLSQVHWSRLDFPRASISLSEIYQPSMRGPTYIVWQTHRYLMRKKILNCYLSIRM